MSEQQSMGGIIRALRLEREWTQEELALRLKVSGQAVSKWETGQSLPDISQVPQLARVLGVTTDELFGLEKQKSGFPTFDFLGVDPEKAWETWQEMREKIAENDGLDGCIWSYVYAGYRLCCPDALLFHPDHAAEVLEETLRYAEARARRMAKSAVYGHSFQSLLVELYALAGNERKALELAANAPPFFENAALRNAAVYRTLGKWEPEANALVSAGTAAANLLLDIVTMSAEAALKLGQTEDAQDAVEFGCGLIGLLKGAADTARDLGNLAQLGARAAMQRDERGTALRWLETMLEKPKQPGAVVRRAFIVSRKGGTAVNENLRRAMLLRELDHPDLAPLREDPEFQALRARVEAPEEE